MTARRRRTLVALVLVAAVCLVVWAAGLPSVRGIDAYWADDSAPVTRAGVEFRGDTAAVTITPATDGRVSVRATGRYSGSRPRVSVTEDRNRMLVIVECFAEPTRLCELEAEVRMPPQLSLLATTRGGPMRVEGLTAPVILNSESAPVVASSLSGAVQVRTMSGPFTAERLHSSRVAVRSDSGAVTAQFNRAPSSLSVATGQVPVRMIIPRADGGYRLSIDSGGAPNSVALTEQPDSPRRIAVRTTGGEVLLQPATG
ncbi:MAG: hypothetical protein CSB46_02960 [Micrococcales bacterium]|nr:MAG: hypothetical protein CSB46_02960 [Micrococcales bacterium]